MNRVILMGRLTRDPELRYSQGESAMAIARYTLAVNRGVSKGTGRYQCRLYKLRGFSEGGGIRGKISSSGDKASGGGPYPDRKLYQ